MRLHLLALFSDLNRSAKNMETRKDGLTVWRYVFWAPHTFFAGLVYIFIQCGLLFTTYMRIGGRDRLSDDSAVLLSVPISLFFFLIFWLPPAINKAALLRLRKRMQKKLDLEFERSHQFPQK